MKPKVNPRRQGIAADEECVLDADHEAAAMRRGNLCLNDWHGHGEKAHAQSLDGPAGNEHLEVGCKGLEEGGCKVDEAAETHALLSADHVSDSPSDKRANGSRNLQAGHEDARDGRVDIVTRPIGSAMVAKEPR